MQNFIFPSDVSDVLLLVDNYTSGPPVSIWLMALMSALESVCIRLTRNGKNGQGHSGTMKYP